MRRKSMTDKERVLDSFERIKEGRPTTDKKYIRPKADRKPYVKRKTDGTFNMGGWRGHPNSLAALEAHRARTQFGNTRRCWCGQPAVTGSNECRFHGGKHALNQRRRKDHVWKPRQNALIKRELRRLLKEGSIPMDLIRVPVFRATLEHAVARIPNDIPRGSTEWHAYVRYWEACARLSLQFVLAWFKMQDEDDHQPWHVAVQVAHELGLSGEG